MWTGLAFEYNYMVKHSLKVNIQDLVDTMSIKHDHVQEKCPKITDVLETQQFVRYRTLLVLFTTEIPELNESAKELKWRQELHSTGTLMQESLTRTEPSVHYATRSIQTNVQCLSCVRVCACVNACLSIVYAYICVWACV